MVIDKLKALKDFDGREKQLAPSFDFDVICVRRNHFRNLNYKMVKLT